MKNTLIKNHGSIQHIDGMPEHIKDLYKTVWEMKMRDIIDMAADRGAFIDQSQSLNLFVETPTFKKLYSMHMHSWKRGLKTGMYYLRSRSAVDAVKVTVSSEQMAKEKAIKQVEDEINDLMGKMEDSDQIVKEGLPLWRMYQRMSFGEAAKQDVPQAGLKKGQKEKDLEVE